MTDVLVVGAGPTGLVLALWLKRAGIDVHIVDKTAEPGTTSRALAIHARTLELYQQLGIADDVVAHGLKFTGINLWARGEHAARVDIAGIGEGLSPFPYVLIFPQDQHERLLLEHLRRAGVEVERRTELVGFEERGNRIVARVRHDGGAVAEHESAYIAGCDGGHSTVREGLGIGFPGGTYERVFYVADVDLRGPASNHELHVAMDDADLLAIFPMKGEGRARLVGTVKEASEERRRDLTWEDVSPRAFERMKLTVDRVHWFSTYRVHHRVAEHFGQGRAFLLGDAAHVHSPVGGQGMNTGIGDAVDLGWKLAAVLRRRADATLLDSYEPERIAFARRLVATTDRVFTIASQDGRLARYLRVDAMPVVIPRLMARARARRYLFQTISQTLVEYRRSTLSEGKAGKVHGGDRLPWVPGRGPADNFAPLASREWQVHTYGDTPPALAAMCQRRGWPLHAFPWTPKAAEAGLREGAAYLVRPDGYVGSADPGADPAVLERYADRRGLRFGG